MTDRLSNRFEAALEKLPELTPEQAWAITEMFAIWVRLKEEHQHVWTREQRRCLEQLDPDVGHSALLKRMLIGRKAPLTYPPPIQGGYPSYP